MHLLPYYKQTILVGTFFVFAQILIAQPQSNKPNSTSQVNPPYAGVEPLPIPYTSGTKVNYVRTRETMKRFPNYTAEQINAITNNVEVRETTAFFDGLGRPLQTVSRQASPLGKDIVAPAIYDPFGREVFKYLPYTSSASNGSFKMNPFVEEASFMQSQYAGEQFYYGKTLFEPSPLNRQEKTFAPGNNWAGSEGNSNNEKAIKTEFLVNNSADEVRIWTIGFAPLSFSGYQIVNTNIPTSTSTYPAGELLKNIIRDEDGNAVVEYKDKKGQLILKKVQIGTIPTDCSGYTGFLSSYYIYDDLSRLRFVIPPKATQAIQPSWQFTTDILDELCFRYEYDDRDRMIAKKVPGAGWVGMVYDKRDRLVFTQDANMRANGNQWMASLYDQLNRPIATGMMTGYDGHLLSLQTHVNNATGSGSNTTVSFGGKSYTSNSATITLTTLQNGVLNHRASNTIVWDDGFVTDNTTDLVDEIYPSSINTTSENQTINDNPLPPGFGFIALTITYYDNYTWTNKAYTTQFNNKLEESAEVSMNPHGETLPTVSAQQKIATRGVVTGVKVRTIEDPHDLNKGIWLSTASFFDDRGRLLQTHADNYRGGIDIATNRYDFRGKLLNTYLVHNNPAVDPANATATLRVRSSMKYDHAGRLLESWKTINDDNTKRAVISVSLYDELGQLKNKKLGKQKTSGGTYTATEIGNFDYSYNIRGWLKSINKDYANAQSSQQSNNANWFGMELNYDWGFTNNQFNGNIGGMKWRSRGDGERRAYGFNYDKSNRLLGGDFSQHNGTSYVDNSDINFDMMMGNGTDPTTAYDENGNIKSMTQWGVKLNTSDKIDELLYHYIPNTNKLLNVLDNKNDPSTKLGDFRTSTRQTQNKTLTTIDYTYDDNGNLKKDMNKDIDWMDGAGILYNHLNLPWQIKVLTNIGNDKGRIFYVYDAAGNKITKTTIEGTQKTINYYSGEFIYESRSHVNATANDSLQFIIHEEGRTRYIPSIGTALARFEHDFFVKDHLGNVRMVLTEEFKQDIYPIATLEGSVDRSTDAVYVEKEFYNVQKEYIVDKAMATGITNYYNKNGGTGISDPPVNNNPNSVWGAYSNALYKLNAQTNRAGLGITLKVMAGDQLNIWGKSYWFNAGGFSSEKNALPVGGLLDAFVSTPLVASKGITSSGTLGTTQLIDALNSLFLSRPNEPSDGKPWAYINWVFFDERFNYAGGGFDRIGSSGTVKTHDNTTIPTVSVPKNGYVFIYCSNESNYNVYFDNLQVVHTRGPLLEETHYYPFGVAMAGISSKALNFGSPENKIKFQSQDFATREFSDGSGLEMYEFKWRMHDPQIGRFWQIDPLSDKYVYNSTYAFSENKVTAHIELEGLESLPINPGDFAIWLFQGWRDNLNNQVNSTIASGHRINSGESRKSNTPGPTAIQNSRADMNEFSDKVNLYTPVVEVTDVTATLASITPVTEAGVAGKVGQRLWKLSVNQEGAAVGRFFGGNLPEGFVAEGTVSKAVGTRFLTGVEATSYGEVVAKGTVDLLPTFERIKSGNVGIAISRNDGTQYFNVEKKLPIAKGLTYTEYNIPTPGQKGAGAMRLVVGSDGSAHFTPDHYKTWVQIR